METDMTTTPKLTPAQIAELVARAHVEGHAAATAAVPTPMIVSDSKTEYFVSEGPCGFAWVSIKPANSAVAKYLVAAGRARKNSYEGGVQIRVSDYGQSIARKEAYARAYAEVLSGAGIRAYSASRMD
jgi:hypothetical protein